MYWLLILTMYSGNGVSVTTEKLGDKMSCIRAGLAFVKQTNGSGYPNYSCTEVR